MADEAGAERFGDFVGLINALHKEIVRIKSNEAKRLGFTGADVMCLYYLVKNPEGLTASELARKADVSRAAMSRTVARLEEGQLIEVAGSSAESGRYRARITLTQKGLAAAQPINNIVADVLGSTGAALSDARRTEMYDSLNQVLEVLRQR